MQCIGQTINSTNTKGLQCDFILLGGRQKGHLAHKKTSASKPVRTVVNVNGWGGVPAYCRRKSMKSEDFLNLDN